MHFHWQNLKGDSPRKWLSGRCWLHFGERRSLSLEWVSPGDLHFAIGVNEGDRDDELHLVLGAVLFTLYVGIPFWRFRIGKMSTTLRDPIFIPEARQFQVYWHEAAIWLTVWGDPMGGWERGMPWWTAPQVLHVDDLLLGKRVHTLVEEPKQSVLIPMLEGCYRGTVHFETRTWKRPRWPWFLVRRGTWVDVDGCVPHEGKGENSWDCGEDGLCGCGVEGHDVPKAVGHFVESVLRSRQRYGGGLNHRDLVPKMAPPRSPR